MLRYSHTRTIGVLLALLAAILCTSSAAAAQEPLPALVANARNSVVLITTYDGADNATGQGTGFFITSDGHLITCWHVLAGAARAEVKLANGKSYPISRILAEDRIGDLVRVAVNLAKDRVTPLSLATKLPQVGERMVLIGCPLGLEQSVTEGIVSAIRWIPGEQVIQTTAPISPGSSGSPALNRKGELVGVATFTVREGQNLNFLTPAARVAALKPGVGKALQECVEESSDPEAKLAYELVLEALALFGIGEPDQAIAKCKEAIRLKPDFALAHMGLGWSCLGLDRYAEAVEAFKEAI
ncbi:MAG TPA: tetratricopeptide repeat-containing serine protease family protein [Armatimonadota bacterium]|nr:tetratricopeptide repeat-containing serine protease family protein [Armatimonadota bacterium]